METITHCPLCNYNLVGTENTHWKKPSFSTTLCPLCSLIFQNPMYENAELQEIYASYYSQRKSISGIQYGYYNYEAQRSPEIFAMRYLPWIFRYANKNGSFLDVGCGTGTLLEALQGAGVHGEGQEFSSEGGRAARQKGFIIYTGPLPASGITKVYNYITVIDVVEHLRNPLADFRFLYSVLRPGGYVFIETINSDDFMVRHFYREDWVGISPVHLFYWSFSTLKQALEKCGFQVVASSFKSMSNPLKVLLKKAVARILPFDKLFGRDLKSVRATELTLLSITFSDLMRVVAKKAEQ